MNSRLETPRTFFHSYLKIISAEIKCINKCLQLNKCERYVQFFKITNCSCPRIFRCRSMRVIVDRTCYRPQTKFAKVMFLQVSVCPQGGHAWLLLGGMHGCSWGGVHGCSGGHAWLLPGGHAWLLLRGRGACVVALGGHAWFFR